MSGASLADPHFLFALANGLAMASWLALAVSPEGARWTPRARQIAGRFVPLVLALAYVALFATNGMGEGGYDSLAAVQRLFAMPQLLLAGWLHYLAFDLFVGAWIAESAGVRGWPHLVVLPLLALTFLFGPAGLLAFALVSLAMSRRATRSAIPA